MIVSKKMEGVLYDFGQTEAEDQLAIQERLDMWDNLLEQDPYIQKKVAKGVEKGRAEGEAKGEAKGEARGEIKGEIRASQRMVIDLVDVRFPSLVDFARQRVQKIKEADNLRQLGRQIATAPDEATALRVLSSYAA